MPRKQRPAAVDLFCGAGGLSYGMQRAGIRICAGIDNDPACRHPFEANIGAEFHEMDVTKVTPRFVSSLFPRGAARILAGCAPCQPFSCYAHVEERDRWTPISKFGRLVDRIRPEIVTMENVPGVSRHPVFERYIRILERAKYHCTYDTVNCAAHGVPQTRRRLVLIASRLGPIDMIKETRRPDRYATVRDTIRHLGRIGAGGVSESDPLHMASGMSSRNKRRIKSSVPGGTWRDWRAGIRAACHRRGAGRSYSSVYGRMEWDRPAPTITTQFHGFGSGRFGHPSQARALSLREGAMLQTFPERYSFVPDGEEIHITRVARMIGNAVPVRLGTAIGRRIMSHLARMGEA